MRPRPALRAAALALVALAGCGDGSTGPLPADGVPDELGIEFSGYGYGSHTVRLQGDTLVVVRRQFVDRQRGPDSSRIVRDAAAWRAFWEAARAAGVARWARTCEDRRVADGGGFALRIVADGRRWESSGINAYPDARGGCTDSAEPSPEYAAFTRAVSALIGRPFP